MELDFRHTVRATGSSSKATSEHFETLWQKLPGAVLNPLLDPFLTHQGEPNREC